MAEQLSIPQVAERYGVSAKTVRRWIASGDLPARRVGPRLVRINAADVADFGRKLA
jgi:excisionase family DNA binding protein